MVCGAISSSSIAISSPSSRMRRAAVQDDITVRKLICWLVLRAVVRVGGMPLSELPALEVCRCVAAPAGKVWALVSDITRVCDWGGECVHAEWIDGADGPGVGARFRGHQVGQGREWTSVSVVTEVQPGLVVGAIHPTLAGCGLGT
jgi:hypothetical protein